MRRLHNRPGHFALETGAIGTENCGRYGREGNYREIIQVLKRKNRRRVVPGKNIQCITSDALSKDKYIQSLNIVQSHSGESSRGFKFSYKISFSIVRGLRQIARVVSMHNFSEYCVSLPILCTYSFHHYRSVDIDQNQNPCAYAYEEQDPEHKH